MVESAIEITGLSKNFGSGRGKKTVVQDLSLTISPQEVFGFLGANGAGKSTTIKILLNFLKADSGRVKIMGQDTARQEFRSVIGYLAEFPFFYDHLTGRETLLLSGRLSGMPSKNLKERIPALLHRMNLADAGHQAVGGYSKGMKQRLGVANALVHDPEVLIFDEPMSGLDPLGRHLIKELIIELKTQGKTVFFSSHILSDIEDLCDRIGIIHKGRRLYTGSLEGFVAGNNSLEDCFVQRVREADNEIIT